MLGGLWGVLLGVLGSTIPTAEDIRRFQWRVGLAMPRARAVTLLRLGMDPARSWAEFCEVTKDWTADELKAEARKLRNR